MKMYEYVEVENKHYDTWVELLYYVTGPFWSCNKYTSQVAIELMAYDLTIKHQCINLNSFSK